MVAQPVADAVIRSVCGVLPVGKLVLLQILQNFLPAHAEHRPQVLLPPGRDAPQPFEAGSPEQVQQKGLRLIIGGVGRGDKARQRIEKIIAAASGCLLDAFPGLPAAGRHIGAGNGERDA